jgi:hypothetical protein
MPSRTLVRSGISALRACSSSQNKRCPAQIALVLLPPPFFAQYGQKYRFSFEGSENFLFIEKKVFRKSKN